MSEAKCSEEEFIKIFQENGPAKTARLLGVDVRTVYNRRARLEKLREITIASPKGLERTVGEVYPKRIPISIEDGIVMICSDQHWWPDRISTANRGFLALEKELKPKVIILNGDAIDGPSISRFAPRGWSKQPKVQEELDTVTARTEEIRLSAPQAELFWMLGNHDQRLENRLSERVPEFDGVFGTALGDHFPHWKIGISTWINNEVVVKHRFKGGIHATHNNTLWAGKTMICGHLHQLKVTPFDDYNGTRWGVDTGTLEDPYGPQFAYDEDSPKNHRSGFIVLTFASGKLLWPEIAYTEDEDHIVFRGSLIKV